MCTQTRSSIDRIVIAIDDSPQSEWAVKVGKQLASQLSAKIMLVHVTEPVLSMGRNVVIAHEIERIRGEQGNALLHRTRLSIPAEMLGPMQLRSGFAADQIVAAAREWRAGLLIMGTHCRGRFAQLALGSVAEGVVRDSPCAVITVAHPPRQVNDTAPDWIGVGADCADRLSEHAVYEKSS